MANKLHKYLVRESTMPKKKGGSLEQYRVGAGEDEGVMPPQEPKGILPRGDVSRDTSGRGEFAERIPGYERTEQMIKERQAMPVAELGREFKEQMGYVKEHPVKSLLFGGKLDYDPIKQTGREMIEGFKKEPVKSLLFPTRRIKGAVDVAGSLLQIHPSSRLLGKGLGIAHQRAEGIVANALMGIQEGKSAWNTLKDMGKGALGERPAQVGDVIRRTLYGLVPKWAEGAVEPLAQTMGMIGMMAVYQGLGSKRPRTMNKKWMKDQPKMAYQGVKEAEKRVGSIYNKVKDPYRSRVVSYKNVKGALKGTNKTIQKEFMKDIKPGKVTMGMIDDIRGEINTEIGTGTWLRAKQGMGVRLNKQHLIQAERALKKLYLDNVDDATRGVINRLDPQWTDIKVSGGRIQSLTYDPKTRTYQFKPSVRYFKDPEMAGAKEIFDNMAKYSNKIGQFAKNMDKYVGRQALKKVIVKVGKPLAYGGGALYGLSKLKGVLEGGIGGDTGGGRDYP